MDDPQPHSPAATSGGGGPDDAPARTTATTKVAYATLLGLLAVVFVVAGRAEPQPDADRIGRRIELIELIAAEQTRARELESQVEQLSEQVESFEAMDGHGAARLADIRADMDEVALVSGHRALRGPGVEVVLNDSSLPTSAVADLNDLVIHEQDLQAVINALWAGGAEAMSVNDNRILATTAIRCVGNTLLLHGFPHSPPYIIRAIGEDAVLESALERDPQVQRFWAAVDEFELAYSLTRAEEIIVPAYTGVSGLQVAQPASASR